MQEQTFKTLMVGSIVNIVSRKTEIHIPTNIPHIITAMDRLCVDVSPLKSDVSFTVPYTDICRIPIKYSWVAKFGLNIECFSEIHSSNALLFKYKEQEFVVEYVNELQNIFFVLTGKLLYKSLTKNYIEMKGIDLIAKERQEQIERHGRTIESDIIENGDRQLQAAAFMLLSNEYKDSLNSTIYPLGWNTTTCKIMKDKDRFKRLVIAGALIAAELDRILNAES